MRRFSTSPSSPLATVVAGWFLLAGCADASSSALAGRATNIGKSAAATSAGESAFALGLSHTCFIADDGTVKCWGWNYYGQLGDGTRDDSNAPGDPIVGLANVVQVGSGSAFSCALDATGGVKCWGDNAFGQLGTGSATPRFPITTPSSVIGVTGATQLAVGANYACALLADATVKCWGTNRFGQLGLGTHSRDDLRATATPVPGLVDVTALSAGTNSACALLASGAVECWGSNNFGQVGVGTTDRVVDRPTLIPALAGSIDVEIGDYHACALAADRTVRCWGTGSYGQFGDGFTGVRTAPPTTPIPGVVGVQQLSAGGSHNCVVSTDTTGPGPGAGTKLVCWGSNTYGQLGVGGSDSAPSGPTTVPEVGSPASVACGGWHTCAVSSFGDAWCWGRNWEGEVGIGVDGSGRNQRSPAAVAP